MFLLLNSIDLIWILSHHELWLLLLLLPHSEKISSLRVSVCV